MRGTEKPQMSASMTPTVIPRAAMAAARFTVTDDLPTPPLPEATIRTLVVAGTSVSGAFSAHVESGPGHGRGLLLGVELVPREVDLDDTPGRSATRARTSRWIWARRGQPEVVRAMVTSTRPSSSIRHGTGHAQLDDVGAQLGIDDAPEHAEDIGLGRTGAAWKRFIPVSSDSMPAMLRARPPAGRRRGIPGGPSG